MTRPWNPNRRLSDAEYRALSASERRALFEARAQARSERAVEGDYARALRQHERRYRPAQDRNPARMYRGLRLRDAIPLAVLGVAALSAGGYGLTSWAATPVASATGDMAVRASFHACKWGGGTNCVVDGDTIYLQGQKIRIAGIDAPETHDFDCASENALGEQAAARLEQLVNSGAITLTAIDRDEDVYGRKLRNVAVDGKDVGDTLIGEGLARAYGGGRRSWC